MTSATPAASELSPATTISLIPPEELRDHKTRLGYDYWRLLRGMRRFPSRDEISPRDIACVLPNMVLIRVLEGGKDFQYRIVGDHAGQGYGVDLRQRLYSDIALELPRAAANWSRLSRRVVESGEPLALLASVGIGATDAKFSNAEAVYLPLGPHDNCVDHLVSFVKWELKR